MFYNIFMINVKDSKGIFITATGTDVGKTFVSALLVKKMREQNVNCGYFKPILSGAENVGGKLVPGDAKHVVETAKLSCVPESCVSYMFEPAVSPHLASSDIKLEKILADYKSHSTMYDFIVVEGAGGIICPLNLSDTPIIMADLIKLLELDIIIVADAGLGTINSTVLTVEFAKQKGINICGIILNKFDSKNYMHQDNKLSIEKLTGIKVIATVKQDAVDIGEINW